MTYLLRHLTLGTKKEKENMFLTSRLKSNVAMKGLIQFKCYNKTNNKEVFVSLVTKGPKRNRLLNKIIYLEIYMVSHLYS